MSTRRFALIAFVVSLLIAGVLSWYASSSPDGLEHVAETTGFGQTAQEHATAGGPLADYEAKGVDSGRLSTGLAGVIGVAVTGLLMGGLVLVLRRRGRSTTTDLPEVEPAERG
ncbi:MAG TPA: PDGLE domain-containing protein [Intrasporangium sp.]|nr:PDGLE domain-containing protein [Intrasporangium sp.]